MSCVSQECRTWPEQKLLAFCKANKLAYKLGSPTMNLINVRFKSEALNEYSHFLFSVVSQDIQKGGLKFKGKFMFRVCVPTFRARHAYVDFKCPFSACTGYERVGNCDRESEHIEHLKDILT